MSTTLVLGRHAVEEALRSGRALRRILVQGVRGQTPPSLEAIALLARQHGVPLVHVSRQTLDRLGEHHQGVAAEAEPFPTVALEEILAAAASSGRPPLLLILDEVQDPQNVGSLLRTAAALGAHGVVLPKHRAAGITPAVERASAGAISWLRIHQATNLVRVIDQLREQGVWVYGLDPRAPARYDEVDLTGPLALVVGSEGKGIRRLVGEHCDRLLRIPMAGTLDSLNVAVAGSIILAEVFRQREKVGQAAEGPLPPKVLPELPARPAANASRAPRARPERQLGRSTAATRSPHPQPGARPHGSSARRPRGGGGRPRRR